MHEYFGWIYQNDNFNALLGINLQILPITESQYCHTRLHKARNYKLFRPIKIHCLDNKWEILLPTLSRFTNTDSKDYN